MKRVQLAGAETAIEQVLVGLVRELRVDVDNDSLRLHDGVKEGGYEFLNRDANDGRYQRRSLELDGFSFGAQEKGILVRVSPSNYKLRKITVDEEQLQITNTRGTAGDFHINLLATILTDHTWSGLHTYTQPIAAQGGVVGNVTGDLTGDSFGTHTGNVIGNADGDHTGSFTGDVDVRGKDFVTDDGQIREEQIDPQAFVNRGVPYGAIILWAGLVDDIPESWALCDGSNGTPDLRDRFIVGAGGAYDEGQLGGSLTHTHVGTLENGGEHQHDVNVAPHALTKEQMPSHDHPNGACYNQTSIYNHGTVAATPPSPRMIDGTGVAGTIEGLTGLVGGGQTHTHAGSTTTSGGAHNHNISLDPSNHLPPYYALCYIMKTV